MLRIDTLVKRYGGLTVTDHVSLSIPAGELHAIIGPNGAGKTTLIRQIAGEVAADAGHIWFDGQDITHARPHRRSLAGLRRSYQITSVFLEFTVLQNVMLAVQAHAGHSFRFWRPAAKCLQLTRPAEQALALTGLSERAHVPVSALAHGQRRQLEMAMTLVCQPRMLVLDEPMAGMSQVESQALVELLARLKGRYTILLVEHDMDAVFALADRLTVIQHGRVLCTGTVAQVQNDAQVRSAYLGTDGAAS